MLKGLKYLVVPLSFLAGVYFADDVKSFRSNFFYEPREGFYCRPYDLRVEKRVIGGKVEVYLADVKNGEYHKIGPKMFVGSPSHRISSVISIPQEYLNKSNLKGLSRLLDSVFD